MKPALASVRTIDILNFMSINPLRAFSMSEISAALELNPASTSRILSAMADAGYLVRHPRHRTFELGPALVAIGHAASERHPVVELARPAMEDLARLGSECVGSALVGDEIIVLAISGRPSRYAWQVRVGQRVPFLAPYGAVYLAWGQRERLARWFERWDEFEPQRKEALLASLETARARGYTIGLYNAAHNEVSDLYARLGERPRNEEAWQTLRRTIPLDADQFILDEVQPGASYAVSSITAPVFNADGAVIYALAVQGMGEIGSAEIQRIGDTLSDACRGITRLLGGHAP
jgi:DNA-binding IclR family transcriptional regulator